MSLSTGPCGRPLVTGSHSRAYTLGRARCFFRWGKLLSTQLDRLFTIYSLAAVLRRSCSTLWKVSWHLRLYIDDVAIGTIIPIFICTYEHKNIRTRNQQEVCRPTLGNSFPPALWKKCTMLKSNSWQTEMCNFETAWQPKWCLFPWNMTSLSFFFSRIFLALDGNPVISGHAFITILLKIGNTLSTPQRSGA